MRLPRFIECVLLLSKSAASNAKQTNLRYKKTPHPSIALGLSLAFQILKSREYQTEIEESKATEEKMYWDVSLPTNDLDVQWML